MNDDDNDDGNDKENRSPTPKADSNKPINKNVHNENQRTSTLLQTLKNRKWSKEKKNSANIFKESEAWKLLQQSTDLKSTDRLPFSTVADLSTYSFKVLTAESLEENEKILHDFIQSQLKAEYDNSESSLTITFEMVLHYMKSNVSFCSFLNLIEFDAISFKDDLLEKIKREEHFKRLTKTSQEKIIADYYARARSFIFKIGTLL